MQDIAAHLRDQLAQLPSGPGVYIFHGQEGDLPIYIGKSINIRSRVLSHLRTPEEASMLRQTQRISFETTAGEVGALLRESHLIKTLHPLFNQRLRRTRQLCSWQTSHTAPHIPTLVYAKDVNFADQADQYGLYGLFSSRRAAEERLMVLADDLKLCYAMLGLEKLKTGKACFRSQLRQCAGACCGQETVQAHHKRLLAGLQAMQILSWPYAGSIVLKEEQDALCDLHVVRSWCHLGTVSTLAQARKLDSVSASFDADAYKILVKPIFEQAESVIEL